jgi:hypothetical protein
MLYYRRDFLTAMALAGAVPFMPVAGALAAEERLEPPACGCSKSR